MDYQRKKKLTYFTIGLIFLFSGVEYAVILPTIWRYLQTLEADPYFLGLALSAFSLSGLLSGPLFGYWSDRTRTTKKIILFSNLFEIIGNFMYFMGYSKWLLLSSRLVAGIGTGAGSSIFGFLSRSTASEDRATVFAAVMVCRQAGLLIGPAFNIFLRLCDFHLGPFVVNKYTAPGLFMFLLWILLQLAVVFMYWDLPPMERRMTYCSSKNNGEENVHGFDEDEVEEETMVTPLTQKYFNFKELENSVMYCLGGVVVIAGFLFVRWLSQHVAERVVLAIGLTICNISCIWCLIFLANPLGGFSWQLTEFIIGVFLQVLGLPFVAVAQVSLFSKVTSERSQGFSQGVRRSVGGLATILGPLWAGGLTEHMYVMMGAMVTLLVMLTIMLAFSYKRLVEPTVEHMESSHICT
ncbi:major facilitator superfamily domain-containing protein 8 isoform X3 [Girardinichthys multiradiatus]|uniref:major facilitator superfamily domain-containing protein 8 isoform X3 n=1 Tax=Girardinichthys multiradiatus TaxID=208333 RepID=UPI001FAB879F|nr:major facilitator superfamily domain-containing protein 8 isoform X3 [Girardinichthys multiradiatus]